MLNRLRLPSPAMAVATIALFVALGGGYATAFSGSGSLKKSGEIGINNSFPGETVRTLPGIGAIRAFCDDGGGESFRSTEISLLNNSGETLTAVGELTVGEEEFAVNVPSNNFPGEFLASNHPNDPLDTATFHVSPANGSKRPQADVQVTLDEGNSCANARVSVLALITEE